MQSFTGFVFGEETTNVLKALVCFGKAGAKFQKPQRAENAALRLLIFRKFFLKSVSIF